MAAIITASRLALSYTCGDQDSGCGKWFRDRITSSSLEPHKIPLVPFSTNDVSCSGGEGGTTRARDECISCTMEVAMVALSILICA